MLNLLTPQTTQVIHREYDQPQPIVYQCVLDYALQSRLQFLQQATYYLHLAKNFPDDLAKYPALRSIISIKRHAALLKIILCPVNAVLHAQDQIKQKKPPAY